MAGLTRLELATSCVTGRHSNQLNYNPGKLIFLACSALIPHPSLPDGLSLIMIPTGIKTQ